MTQRIINKLHGQGLYDTEQNRHIRGYARCQGARGDALLMQSCTVNFTYKPEFNQNVKNWIIAVYDINGNLFCYL